MCPIKTLPPTMGICAAEKVEKKHFFPFSVIWAFQGLGWEAVLWLGAPPSLALEWLGQKLRAKTLPGPEAKVPPASRWKESLTHYFGEKVGKGEFLLKLEPCICLGLSIIPLTGERLPYFLSQPPQHSEPFIWGVSKYPTNKSYYLWLLEEGQDLADPDRVIWDEAGRPPQDPWGWGVVGPSPAGHPRVPRREGRRGKRAIAIEL